ncbi:hypothetical protein U0355_12780 [Salimicrobium sp. PL1-032A]|uniref:hypothetical protein n=1 Tax=Salimicrobium sp. PL1-032A TaxID=3095364 RepID=UPI00325FEC64
MEEKERVFEINKKNQARTNEISMMINEGGLGADRYYIIKYKQEARKKAARKAKDSGASEQEAD